MITISDSALKNIASFLEKNKGKKVFVEHEVKIFLKSLGLLVPNGILVSKDGYISLLQILLISLRQRCHQQK